MAVCLLYFILIPFLSLYGEETIAICLMSDGETDEMTRMKTYFEKRGYVLNVYKKAKTLERQIENVNRINRSRANLFLAMDIRLVDKERFLVAYGNAKSAKGKILTIEEIPGKHIERSKELAGCVATFLGTSPKEIPLFPLLGIDTPGIFLSIETTKERLNDIYERVDDCLKNFFRRDVNNEG